MSLRDKRDMEGTFLNCPDAGRGDTSGHPRRGGVPVSPVSPASTAERLRRVARQLGRLSPNWRDPEAFFEERSELERELRRAAREVELG